MFSHEALGLSIGRDRVAHAKALHRSTDLVSKWTEPTTDFSQSGSINPLDRLETIISTSLDLSHVSRADSLAPIQFLAHRFNGLFLPLPPAPPCLRDLSHQLMATVKEFGDTVSVASEAMSDGHVSALERRAIEKKAMALMAEVGQLITVLQGMER